MLSKPLEAKGFVCVCVFFFFKVLEFGKLQESYKDKSRYWQGCGQTAPPTYCFWTSETAQSLWKMVWGLHRGHSVMQPPDSNDLTF